MHSLRNALFVATALLGIASPARAALGLITASFTPASPVATGNTITVTLNLSGYTEATEIDAFAVLVTYPASLFNFVAGSASYNSADQWLAKSNQDTGYSPSSQTTSSTDGQVILELTDLGTPPGATQGSNSSGGFLASFQLVAEGPGAGSITPAVPGGGTVFFDKDLASVPGAPTFSGALITVIPEPSSALLLLLAGQLIAFRRRRSPK